VKIGLACTTIHVPHALKLMRKCSADVRFFVATDEKTPVEARDFVHTIPNAQTNGEITSSVWKCSEAIGWNTIARRNIAFLEALKWGADVIYSWDDDNLPINYPDHFWLIQNAFASALGKSGIKVTGADGWFDPGMLLVPPTRHRGFPHYKRPSLRASPVIDAKVGVAAGLVIGDPDVDATTRMEHRPDIGSVHILGSAGVVVDPDTWTIWNSQNSAVVRELIPAWFMAPGCQRHDDIFASLVVQRVMRYRGYHVHFGPPFTFQQRNEHDLLIDLRAEIDGMSNVSRMAGVLDELVLNPAWTVAQNTRTIYEALAMEDWYPKRAVAAALAWLEDCEGLGL
jgi:hypothetical protein